MGVARRWVFPIIRLLLLAAIAIALVRLAFFAGSTDMAGPATPTGRITEPHVAVATGTITNNVVLKATVSADPAVPIKATDAGTVDAIKVTTGQAVGAGDTLFSVKVQTPRDPVESTDADGRVTVTQPKPKITWTPVTAPIAGVVSALSVIQGQAVTVGDVAGQVAPPSFSVSGSLSPEQQYRLLNQPTDATVSITGGPGEFTCTGLTITAPLAGADPSAAGAGSGAGADGGGGGASGGTTVRCAVPADVKVFSGLAAELTISGGKAENVSTVPTTAVKGTAQSGTVWLVGANGKSVKHAVKLGLTDGTSVQITEGLAVGDEVLEFVPGAVAPANADGCAVTAGGATFCGHGG